jgi:hypothetical protein
MLHKRCSSSTESTDNTSVSWIDKPIVIVREKELQRGGVLL